MKKQIFLFALTALFAGISSVSDGATKPSLLLKAGDPAFVEVRKVPVVDCRVVRGFLGTPVDGSVKSKDYRGRAREYPHTASDGVVYSYNRNDGIHITLKGDEGFDMVVLRGGAKANLYTDVTGRMEPDAGALYTFAGDRETETVLFDRRVQSKLVSVFGVKEGEAADISFYRVEKQSLKFASMDRWTAGGEVALPKPESEFASQSVYRAMQERYPEGERRVLGLVHVKGKGVPVEAKSRQAVHFISPPFEGDGTRVGETLDRKLPGGLFGLSLDVVLSGAAGPISFTAAVQDPLNPRLDLTWVEFTVEKPGRVRIALDVPDQVLLEGSRLWVTLRFDRDVTLSGPDGGAPEFRPEIHTIGEALPEALDRRKFLMRTFFSLLSEPRPWGRYRNQSREAFYASSRYAAQCPELFITIDQCHTLSPTDDLVRQYREWVYLRNLESLSEVDAPPAPPEGVPAWAWYPRLAWLEVRRILDWWLEERLVPTGEFGGRVGDDSDFYQQFVDLPFLETGGVAAKGMDSAARMAELADKENLREGINVKATDALHAYEEGINHLALMARWFYGDPIYFERCMDSARNMEFLTVVTEDGRRHFPNSQRMGYEDIQKPRQLEVEGHASPLMWHTALQVADYNRNPHALKILREWADTWLGYMKPGQWATSVEVLSGKVTNFREDRPLYGGYSTQASTFTWLYGLTGDRRYIGPFLHYYRQGRAPHPSSGYLGDVYSLGGLDDLDRGVLDSLTAANTALAVYREGDVGPLVERAIGSPRPGGSGISTLHDARRWPDMYTESHQFTDRIFPSLLQQASVAYLGGFTRRNKMNPTLAVSWEGFGTDYGALVVDNRRDRVKALVYSYADAPVEGKVRVWNLAHGRYRVRMGPDGDGDWRMDREVRDGEMELMKADVIDLTLSPGRITVIEIEQVEALDPIFSRGDLAISAREVVVKGEVVSGTVHNIGSADVLDGVVAVLDAMGNVVARTSVGRIPAPLDLVPVRAPFTLRLPNKPSQGWKLTLDPDGQVSEIYEGNNEVLLDALPAVDYSGVGMK